jgi:hypothetical protein
MTNIETNASTPSDNSGSEGNEPNIVQVAATEASAEAGDESSTKAAEDAACNDTIDAAEPAAATEPPPAKPALVAANDNFPKLPQLFHNAAYADYKSRLREWDRRASVRVGERRELTSLGGALPFSPDLVPIAAHPLVAARSAAALHTILGQKLHSYLNFTEQLELRNVIPTSINLRRGDVPFLVPHALQRDAGKVVTDEAHHADCASDLDEQVAKVAGAVYRVRPAQFAQILHRCRSPFRGRERVLLDTTFTTVSETLITGTLTQVPKDRRVAETIRDVITDHARDEAQHHAVFSDVMRIMWEQLRPAQKDVVGPHWAIFIKAFLMPDPTAELDWLEAAGFDREEADRIVRDTYEALDLAAILRDAARPTILMAEKFGLTDHAATRDGFESAGLLLPTKGGAR